VPEQQSSLAKKIVKGAVVVLFFWFFWKFGGFLLNIIIGSLFPPGKTSDAYTGVYKTIIFTFIYSSALKVLVPAFMPVFIEKMSKDGEAKAWEFAYSIFNIVLILSIVVSGIGVVAAPFIIDLLVPGFSVETKQLCVSLLRIMLPGSVGLVLSMVMMSLFNSYKIFSFPAAADAAQKLVWAVAIFLGAKLLGMDARTLAYGFLVGCIVQLAINGVGLGRKRTLYRPLISTPGTRRLAIEFAILGAFGALFIGVVFAARPVVTKLSTRVGGLDSPAKIEQAIRFTIFTAGLLLTCGYSGLLSLRARGKTSIAARFAALAAPLLIGVVFARYRDVVTFLFQSYTETGVFASVEFAKNIGNFPIVLVAYGLSVAMFPYLCELASGKDLATFGNLVTRAIRMIALFFIPLSIAMVLLNKPVVALVYDRGNWSTQHIGYTATALSLFVFALFFYAIENVIMQAFFSVQRMWAPTFMGIVSSLAQVIFLTVGISVLGYNNPYDIFLAVSIAYPLTRILKEVALLVMLRRRVPILPLRETAVFFAKLAVVCGAFGATVYYSYRVLDRSFPIEDYKRGDVILDTFNAETRGWSSRDASDLRIADAGNRQALEISYKPLSRREVTVEHELDQFLLEGVSRLSFWCKASEAGKIALELSGRWGKWRSDILQVGTEWQQLAVDVAPRGRVRRLTIVIPKGENREQRQLFIDDIKFMRNGGADIVVDYFGQPSTLWEPWQDPRSQGVMVGQLVVDEIDGEQGSAGVAERGLLLYDGQVARNAVRACEQEYDLSGTDGLRFKVKATVPGTLRVLLGDAEYAFEKTVRVEETEGRKTFTIPFGEFSVVGEAPGQGEPFDTARLTGIVFGFIPDPGAAEGKVWLDNPTFTVHRGPAGLNLRYEIVKLLCVAIPCALGGIVLIAFIFIMRIEEGRMVLDWMLEQGRAKLASRLRKRASATNGDQSHG